MFDSDRELLDKIRLGESTYLELKEVYFRGNRVAGPRDKKLADELAAFANSEGGVCVLGVADDPIEIVGIPPRRLDAVVAWVRHLCGSLVEPNLVPIIDRLWLPTSSGDDVAVVKVEVRRSLFVHSSPSGYLHRVGDEKRRMSTDYLARLFQQRSQTRMIRFDEQLVHDATTDALSADLWERFRTSRTRDAPEVLLAKLRMAREDAEGTLRPTVSGVLMAAREPRRWIRSAFIQAVAYRGQRVRPRGEGEAYQLDAKDIGGPLDRQVEDACRFVARNMKMRAFKDLGRIDRPQFDMAAVFEAVVNAVAHRDYSIHGANIRLRLFSDRLELHSPGGIPNTLGPDNLFHVQVARNEFIASLLAKCPVPVSIPGLVTDRNTLMDKRGEGMQIIHENSLAVSGVAPEYRVIGDAEFVVVIHGAPVDR